MTFLVTVLLFFFFIGTLIKYADRKWEKKQAILLKGRSAQWARMPRYAQVGTMFLTPYRWGLPVIIWYVSLWVSIWIMGLVPEDATALNSFNAWLVWGTPWIISGVVMVMYLGWYIRSIPFKDDTGNPNVGLVVFFGVRIPIIFVPGYYLSAPGINIILYQSVYQNRKITVEGVRCRLDPVELGLDPTTSMNERIAKALTTNSVEQPTFGGKVDIEVSLTVQPNYSQNNPWGLIDIDNNGGIDACIKVLTGMLFEDFRQFGRRLDAEQLTFGPDILSVAAIAELTGKKKFVPEEGSAEIEILENPTDVNLVTYQTKAYINGFEDVKGLGLLVRRVNIERVIPLGGLLDAAEKAAVARLERAAGIEDAQALGQAVAELKKSLGGRSGMSAEQLLDRVQIERGKQTRKVTRFEAPDAEKLGTAIGKAVTAAFGGMMTSKPDTSAPAKKKPVRRTPKGGDS